MWTSALARVVDRILLPRLESLGIKRDSEDDFHRTFAELEFAISDLLSEDRLGQQLLDLWGTLDKHARAEMTRVLGIDVAGQLPSGLANDFVRRNVELIRTSGLGTVGEVKDLVIAGARAQVSYADLSAQIQARYGVTEARANLIARDQVLKSNADLSRYRAQAAGVTRYEWSTSKDERVRGRPGGKWPKGTHWDLEGTIHSWDNPPMVDERRGRREHPGRDYQCRCVAIPLVDDLLYADD